MSEEYKKVKSGKLKLKGDGSEERRKAKKKAKKEKKQSVQPQEGDSRNYEIIDQIKSLKANAGDLIKIRLEKLS